MGKFSSHIIYKNSSDEEIPSTTNIIKMLNKDSLIGWSNYIGRQGIVYEDFIQHVADIGTLTHKYIEDYLNQYIRLIYRMDNEIERSAYLAFNNFIRYYQEHGKDIEVINTELKVEGEDYGGTIDLYCKYRGRYRIMDFKTSKSVYDTHFLQLGGYTYLMESKGYTVDEVAVLSLNKAVVGKYIIKMKSRADIQPYVDAFLELKAFFYKWYSITG